jgi:hypothetical protein
MSTKNESPVAATKVVTGKVRFSYLHVWEPTSIDESSDKKYSVSLIIPKSDKATIAKIQKAIENAAELGKGKWGGKIPAKLKTPLRDGDVDRPDDAAYANAWFINASCKSKPGVVDANLNAVLQQDEVYSGCYGRASINFYAYDAKGNKGIAAGLNNLQKLEDGDALGGRASAEADFGGDDFLD